MLGGERFGSFALLERLPASSGSVERWRAIRRDPFAPQRALVVKRLAPRIAPHPAFFEAFETEAWVRGRGTAHLPPLVEHGEVEGRPFLALEHVPGVSLLAIARAAREQGGLVPLPIALFVIARVANILDDLHFASDGDDVRVMPARDVHPRNVVIAHDGHPHYVGIEALGPLHGDFSSGAAASSRGRLFAEVYLSPEQLLGDPVDHRTDIFSLGAVLYELVTGHSPCEAESDLAALLRLRDVDFPPPSALNPAVHGDVEAVILRCLARDPQRRYGRASDLAAELDAVLGSLEEVTPAQVRDCARSLCADEWRREQDALDDAANWDEAALEAALHAAPRGWDDDTVPDITLEEDSPFASGRYPDSSPSRPPHMDRRSPAARPRASGGRKVRAPQGEGAG